MTRLSLLLVFLFLSLSSFASLKFGEAIKANKGKPFSELVKNYKGGSMPAVLLGKVEKVCEKKGCWMTIKSDSENLRVTFKDYGFFVPVSLMGKKVLAEGILSSDLVSVADQRHFAEDAGKSKKEIQKIVKDKREYRFVASGLKVIQ